MLTPSGVHDPEVIQIGRNRLADVNPHPEAVPRGAVQDQGPGLPLLHLARVGQFLLLLDDGLQTLVIEEDPPDLSQIGPIQKELDAGSPLTTQRNCRGQGRRRVLAEQRRHQRNDKRTPRNSELFFIIGLPVYGIRSKTTTPS